MTGNKSFTKFTFINDKSIKFGNGNMTLIYRIRYIKVVLYVEGLKTNLISINQICDNKYTIKFTKKDCTVYDDSGNALLKSIRSKENYYCMGTSLKMVCKRLSLSIEECWNQ